jgi:hypothetical protein
MEHDPRLRRVLESLPADVRRRYVWLIGHDARWVRRPVGALLVAGGLFGFLPVLGFWMLPLGALLIGEDIPVVRRATLYALGWAQRRWDAWRAAPGDGKPPGPPAAP